MTSLSSTDRSGRRAHVAALATALLAIPLVIFGGSVTTLGAGMSVQGWLIAEGHFMLFLPIDTWIDDTHRFVEHVHRLFGTAVGIAAIVACVLAWIAARRGARSRGAALVATGALLAVIVQGTVGGERVELMSDRLAFLHGALAQAVLAVLFTAALVLSPAWRAAREAARRPAPRMLALVAVLVTYGQVVIGSWYRHELRPAPEPISGPLLLAHLGGAVLVLLVVVLLARRLKASAGDEPERRALARAARRLHLLLGLQILLGLVAWLGYRPDAIGPIEWGTGVLHVLTGGLLLAQVVAAALWCHRLGSAEAAHPAPLGAGGHA